MNKIASDLISQGLSYLGIGNIFGSGKSFGATEDFNNLRSTVRKLVRTNFQKDWLFRLAIAGEPSDFDLFVKDISYGLFEVGTDDIQAGAGIYSYPTSRQAQRVTATIRDNADGVVYNFLKRWQEQIVHSDGTVGLPYGSDGYVKNVSLYNLQEDGSETLVWEAEMYPIQCGEVSRSRENGNFMELPVSFVQFSNIC